MIVIDDQTLTYDEIYRVAMRKEKVRLGAMAREKVIVANAGLRQKLKTGQQLYGVNTGFGALRNTTISENDIQTLQKKLIMSHAVGVGQPFDDSVVRGMMLIIVNYLSKGHSGVRSVLVDTFIEMLNKDVCPIVPEKGSVGSSGDLAPSAHIALVLTGRGEAKYNGKIVDGSAALKKAGITPVTLQAKEGLAIINNTSCMTSIGASCLHEAVKLATLADICGALSAEALRAGTQAFEPEIHALKPHRGQIAVAEHLTSLLKGSTMVDRTKNQDQYSIRCIPQIHGGIREAIRYVKGIVTTEIDSVTDNPLIFVDNDGSVKIMSGGNFHGEAMAIAMDTLGISLSEIANVSDRRIASLLDPSTNNDLPAFLTKKVGLNSGLMILQYTTASLVSENKVLAHPSSVDSIPTSANIEDLVSMGTFGARKARDISLNVMRVLAIELIVSCQAIDLRMEEGFKLGVGTRNAYDAVRSIVPFFPEDEVYYPYINQLTNAIHLGNFTAELIGQA